MHSSIFQRLALAAIRAYQRWLSPHKGFVCAFRVHTGRDSCSAYGYRVISRYGIPAGMTLLRRRLHQCGVQHRLHTPLRQPQKSLRNQAGFCDASCDVPSCEAPCELPSMESACDIAECGCDLADLWPDKRKREEADNARQRARLLPEHGTEE